MPRPVSIALVCAVLALAQDMQLRIPPVKASVDIGKQPITITTTGLLSGNQKGFRLNLTVDLSELQAHAGDLLRAQLDRSEECGERISVERATLVPQAPAGLLTAYVHYERWACMKALGTKVKKRLIGGNGTVPVKLTPGLENGNQVTLTPEVGQIEADGSLGDVLRSPSVQDKIRDKIRDSILHAMQRGVNLQATLPPAAQRVASIRSAQFADGGSGALVLQVAGEVRVPPQAVQALIEQLTTN